MMVNPTKKKLKLSREVNPWLVLDQNSDQIKFNWKKDTPQEIKDKWELGKKLYGWKD